MAATSEKPQVRSDDEQSVIASLEETFGLHIKSAAEAARIRKLIAAHVSGFVVNDGLDGSSAIQIVRQPGNEITGVRRKYLEALKSNVEARAQYKELRQLANTTNSTEPLADKEKAAARRFLQHLEVSQLRRNLQELEIRGRYAETLNQDNVIVCNLALPATIQEPANGSEDETETLSEDIASTAATTKGLTLKLQKALLQATHQLEREKALLADLKSRYAALDVTVSPRARLDAIEATRNVLVQELEAKLTQNGIEEMEGPEELHPERKDVDLNAKERQERIGELYQRYVTAREKLLVAAGRATGQLPTKEAEKEKEKEKVEANPTHQKTTMPRSVLPAITQRLIPLLQLQASSTAMRSFVSSLLSKERTETLEALIRLGEESHLLPTHPMAENIAAAEEDEVAQHVKSWEFAALEAEATAKTILGQQVEEGMKGVEDGEESLKNLRRYLGDVPESSSDGKKMGTRDVGWRGLNGRLGLDADP